MGPHSTQALIALAGQGHVILSMACTATLKEMSVPLQLLHSVQSKMVQQQTTRTAGAEVWSARVPQGSFVIRRMEEVLAGRLASVHSVILKKRVTKIVGP